MAYIYSQLIAAQFENLASDPASTASGLVYFNTTSNISKYYNGSAWKTFLAADFSNVTGTLAVANGGTGVTTSTGSGSVVLSTSPTLVTPALGTPASGVATNLTGLPIDGGTTGTLPVSRGGTGQTSQTAAFDALAPTTTNGDIIYHNGTDNVRLPIGTDGQTLKVSSGIPAWGDGGAGAGEINAILNPSAASATTGWSDDANHSKTRLTSGSPLDPVITTAFRFTKDNTNVSTETSTSGVYYPFTLPTGLESKKLKVEFYCIVPATGVWKVSVYDGSTRLALSTDSSGATILPAGVTGKFVTYFDATANNSYTVSFTETSGVATNLDATNIIVGPGIQPQGAVVDEWKSYTPTFGSGFGTVSVQDFKYRRVGSSLEIQGNFTVGTVAASAATLSLPSGLTVGGFRSGSYGQCGRAISNSTTVNNYKDFSVIAQDTQTAFRFGVVEYASSGAEAGLLAQNGNAIFVSGIILSVMISVPIAEWAGSGTVNLAQNDVEYASNSNTGTGNDTTSFVTGPAGSTFVAAQNAGGSNKRVRFQTPIQSSDVLTLEYSSDRINWAPLVGGATTTQDIASFDPTNDTGAAVLVAPVNATDVDVRFRRYATGATNWATTGGYWRVKKSSGGQAVGFGMATATQSGLVSSYEAYTAPSAASTGAITTSAVWKLTKIGNLVTLTLPATTGTASAASNFAFGSVIPSRFRPTADLTSPVDVLDNGSRQAQVGMIFITASTGLILVYRSTTSSTNFTAAATAGINEAKSISWTI